MSKKGVFWVSILTVVIIFLAYSSFVNTIKAFEYPKYAQLISKNGEINSVKFAQGEYTINLKSDINNYVIDKYASQYLSKKLENIELVILEKDSPIIDGYVKISKNEKESLYINDSTAKKLGFDLPKTEQIEKTKLFFIKYYLGENNYICELNISNEEILTFDHFQKSRINESIFGPFIGLICFSVLAIILVFMDINIPKYLHKYKKNTAIELIEQGKFEEMEPQVFKGKVNGFDVIIKHHVNLEISKYGNNNYLEIMLVLSNKYTSEEVKKLGFKMDIERKDGQAYHCFQFHPFTKMRFSKIAKLIIKQTNKVKKLVV